MEKLYRNDGAEVYISFTKVDSQERTIITEGLWFPVDSELPINASYLYDTQNYAVPVISEDGLSVEEGGSTEEILSFIRERRKMSLHGKMSVTNLDLDDNTVSQILLDDLYPEVENDFTVTTLQRQYKKTAAGWTFIEVGKVL